MVTTTRMGTLAMNLALLGYPLEVLRSAPRVTPVNGGSKRTRARRKARARAKVRGR